MILIVDDDKAIRASLSLVLRRSGHDDVKAVGSPQEALDVVRMCAPRLILMDMNFTAMTSGEEGLELLRKVKVLMPEVPVILITAWGSIPLAVEGMRYGAMDFITKPWDNRALLRSVDTALELSASHGDDALPASGKQLHPGIIGDSPQLRRVLDVVGRIAATDASVLVLGENGTGKELIAEAIHRNSRRASRPFVKVNLGGVSTSLFESEMFGHRKGAFTGAVSDRVGRFEMADGGTIFLDEIGDLDMASQVKLLRVLQEHTFEPLGDSRPRRVDIRVVSATNAPLEEMVANRTFREDLYYRINLITVTLPPLRERREDIPQLVRYFAACAASDNSIAVPKFSAGAMDILKGLPYPGNIRELKNLVERTMLVASKPLIDVCDLPPEALRAESTGNLENIERQAVADALRRHDGNLSQAAADLGVTRQTLYRRMAKYGLGR